MSLEDHSAGAESSVASEASNIDNLMGRCEATRSRIQEELREGDSTGFSQDDWEGYTADFHCTD